MAIEGFGATLTVDGSAVAEVLNVGGPGITGETIDSTHMESDDGWRERIAGLADGGELTASLQFVKATYNTLFGKMRSSVAWVFTLSDGSSFAGNGIITSLSPDTPLDDKVTCELTITVSGKPTFTPGA